MNTVNTISNSVADKHCPDPGNCHTVNRPFLLSYFFVLLFFIATTLIFYGCIKGMETHHFSDEIQVPVILIMGIFSGLGGFNFFKKLIF